MTTENDASTTAQSDSDRTGPQAELPVPEASIIIAAHDLARWDLLVRAVESAAKQPGSPQIVIAVDNNPELYRRAKSTFLGALVVLNERTRGASVTRNTGAAAASGQYLVFLDDDAAAKPGWLDALLSSLRENSDVVGVGGGVLPDWQLVAPRWFPLEFGWVVGASYTGMPVETAVVRNVWSENMAVRTSDFWSVGGFREGFGKVGNASRPEDTEFCVRLEQSTQGRHWLYEPAALITHHIPPSRATLAFFLRRCFAEGRGKAALSKHVGQASALETEHSYVRVTLARGIVRGLIETSRGDVYGMVRSGIILAGGMAAALGYAAETWSSRADGAPVVGRAK